MLEIVICCSPADREVAQRIGDGLEHKAELDVVFEDSVGESVAGKWEAGLSSAAILLLMSPESVPPRADRTEWGALLDHVTSKADPPLGSVLVRGCTYPPILERSNFFRWADGPLEAQRAIERWALELHRDAGPAGFTPARLPWFAGRGEDLDALWATLVDGAGTAVVANEGAASGKSALAQEFCRRAGAQFRHLIWVACGERSPASIAAELAQEIGVECPGEEEDPIGRMVQAAGRHRVLLVLDDLPPGVAFSTGVQGRASVLITTRSPEAMPGALTIRYCGPAQPRPAAPDSDIDLRLLRAMAVCRPGSVLLELAVRIAGLDPNAARQALNRLIEGRWADPFDDAGGRLRLSRLPDAFEGDGLDSERRRHAELIRGEFAAWAKRPAFDDDYVTELMPAVRWAAGSDWPLAVSLGRMGFAFLRHRGRIAEGAELLEALRDAADARDDEAVSDECSRELSWIRGEAYRGLGRAVVSGDQLRFDFGG